MGNISKQVPPCSDVIIHYYKIGSIDLVDYSSKQNLFL